MKIIKPLRQTTLAILSILGVSVLSSCEEYNPFSEQELFNQEYSKNFFAKYGNFPADFNWDFSNRPRTGATDGSVFDLGSNTRGSLTRAGRSIAVEQKTGWFYTPTTTIEKLYKNILVEGRNNTDLGKPFVLQYDNIGANNSFAIIPIFKGYGELKWTLHLATATEDVILWDPKWTDVTVTDSESGDVNHYYQLKDFQFNKKTEEVSANDDGWQDMSLSDDMSKEANGHLRRHNRSHPIVVSNISGEFYLYLEITDRSLRNSDDKQTYVGEHQSSKEGMMLALNSNASDLGIEVNTDAFKDLVGVSTTMDITQVMVIGCEDCKWSDWDINDISFLCVGLSELPRKRVALSKRYMIEDLGSTVDWDFNDVVVDVTETYLEKDGVNPTYEISDIVSQEARIMHLCGTVPFQVYFDADGNTSLETKSFDKIQGIVQNRYALYQPNNPVKLTYVSGGSAKPFWNSSTNNIKVKVFANQYNSSDLDWNTSGNDPSAVYTVAFPKKEHGTSKAPLIIATNTAEMWTEESHDIPATWISGN